MLSHHVLCPTPLYHGIQKVGNGVRNGVRERFPILTQAVSSYA
jgi:hypothetical protein